MVDKRAILASAVLAGHNQKTLARVLGISKNTMCRKINGKSDFTSTEIVALCKELSIGTAEEVAKIFLQ